MKRALFLDRDGTLIEEYNYLNDLNQVQLIPSVVELCKLAQSKGYDLFIVTNQSGIARGYFDESFVEKTHNYIQELLDVHDIIIKAFYYCSHHPEYGSMINCNCRKPKPGMLTSAAKDHDIDLSRSFMLGDTLRDVESGKAAGCESFLMDEINIIQERILSNE